VRSTETDAHARVRGPGASRWLYALTRVLLAPLLRGWFRLHVSGAEHVPEEDAAILAPNHKSFWDPFFVGMALRRSVRFMAKVELFRGPLGPVLPRLGAFPVRRGASDEESMRTARTLLEGGELVVLFPEGTRVEDPDALAKPHHGAARLALATGAPIVPVAIEGTADLWLGPLPKPHVVRVAFLPPVAPAADDDSASALIDEQVWPALAEEYGRLRALPGLVAAGLAAIGIGALVARKRRQARRPRLLGTIEPRRLRKRRARRRWPWR
jgi:1-acyl-sn-glycerol-3-phosphate acyltransferase